ncbi:hypothetical protein [Halorubrum sp. N11]|uniref:hypothetical protein n=1 Tax=Halorubrum sp. N11 TaxID=3402276 RepID=UPI003EB8E669
MGLAKDGVKLVGFLLVATVLGGVLAGVGDVTVPSVIDGTPLGPRSEVAPIAWTVIAGAVIYGFSEVRG